MSYKTRILFPLFLICLCAKIIVTVCEEKEGSESSSYVISCGASSAEKDSDGRNWEADSKFLADSDKSSKEVSADVQDPSLPSVVPYMSARIFTSKTSYNVPVSSKTRLWLRLHFYPSSYASFKSDNSYFAVNANGFTLLSNFSASLTAKALTLAYIVHEFSIIPVESGKLEITFTPSSHHNNTFAFVNGIEVIPMPEIFHPAKAVGIDQDIDITTNSLETMYRLNVGGSFISPSSDKLNRTWYDDMPYLYGSGYGVTSDAKKNNVSVRYSKLVSEDIAPLEIYRTSRSMGAHANINVRFNLTWAFQIHYNFSYLVRCHFCDYQVYKINQRVFNIYINNQTAEEAADVMAWSGGRGAATYKDYVAPVSDQLGDEVLWLALHPSEDMQPEYMDSFLNGVEIFKVSDENRNLAGPNPDPSEMLLKAEAEAQAEAQAESSREFYQQSAGHTRLIIGGVAGGAAGFTIVALVAFIVVNKKKRASGGGSSGGSAWLPVYGHSKTTTKSTVSGGKTAGSSHLSSLAQGLCRHFFLAEIKSGTKNFHESNVIGVGGFGKVYKGVVDKKTMVAIKRSNPSSEQGVHEFQTEIEMLSKLRHKHLVSLIGFCEEEGEMILVYDYMSNGTLREHLYKSNKPPLTWTQRLDICIGAARGLHYLHTGAKYTIIHRDVKTTNILLDDKWIAKVSDFGLSKTGPNLNQTHVSTMVKGSFGYLDPEYFRRQQLTEKSDVYSFGVVLFEVLCARPALNASLPKEQVSLADWALHCKRKGCLDDLIDPLLKGTIKPECLKKFVDTADKCLSDSGPERPSMGDVLWNLEFACQVQQGSPKGAATTSQPTSTIQIADQEDADGRLEETTDSETLSTVFSQLKNQSGR